MRNVTTALVLTTALLGWTTTAALAQDAAKPAASAADSAEDAFLKAYFHEKELNEISVAERMYAAIIEQKPADREVLARALLGRARCLRFQKHTDDADALFARVEKDFADIKDAASEARDARQALAAPAGASFEGLIRSTIRSSDWQSEVWKFGERGVPTLVAMLRDDSPDLVYRAAESLARMDVPAAHDALAAALDARSSTYPEQVRNAAESDYACVSALRRLTNTKDADVRTHALSRLVYGVGDASAIESVVADAALLTSFIKDNNASEGHGRLLIAALAHGGDARAAALARLRGDTLSVDAIGAFLDPPPAVLADAEAVVALAPLVEMRLRASSSAQRPSAALVAAMLRQPQTAKIGVRLTLYRNVASADPGAFVDAVARSGFGDPWAGRWDDAQLAEALVSALGAKPSPELLNRLAAAWPVYTDWNLEGGRLPAFLQRLIASGVDDEKSLRAFQDGLAAEPTKHHQAFTEALRGTRKSAKPVGAWAAVAFLHELALKTDRETHEAAAAGLDEWQEQFGDACGLATKTQQIVAALGEGGSDHLTTVLGRIGPSSIDALKAALPAHPHKAVVAEALAALGDKSAADAIESALAAVSEIADDEVRKEDLDTAVTALVKVRGDAAKDTLAAAMRAHGGRDAGRVLGIVGDLGDERHGAPLGDRPCFELYTIGIEIAPHTISDWCNAARQIPPEMLRELAIGALKSASAQGRRFGAVLEQDLLDVAAWDALLVATQDMDTGVRDDARNALRAIRAKETELAEFRAMGEERATRKRIEKLLAAGDQEQRRAGVAAIAATGLAGMVNELIRLAAEDTSESVRDDARKALLAMAKPAAPATQPPAEKK